jgi:AraC-like DNA-binding protein
MRATFESVSSSTHASFLTRQFTEKAFSAPFHFHPEFELTLIVQGTGKRYVGAHMCDYFPGDLVLLGSNLPHCWKTDPSNTEDSISIVIHFNYDFLGPDFLARPELRTIQRLLDNSKYGIHFKDTRIDQRMKDLNVMDPGFHKLQAFLDILDILASAPDGTLLDRQETFPNPGDPEKERMNAVVSYIVENFRHEISLQKAASVANMTHQAFCRYFRRITRRSFMQVVIDYRVDFARQQLIYSGNNISQIAFDCGFNDISNFHKTFKSRMGCSPLVYRKQFSSIAATT